LKSPWREMTKQALNAQMTKGTGRVFSTFGFRHSFVLRHSLFVIWASQLLERAELI
jgi:hypothetical protein